MRYFFLVLVTFCSINLFAQEKTQQKSKAQFVEGGAAFGSSQGSFSAGYNYIWYLGKAKRFFVGTGVRFIGFYGTNVNFTSAPPALAGKPSSEDTLLAANPGIYALNAVVNIGYQFSKKIQVGFNIDATGVSFGPTGKPAYISNGVSSTVSAQPTSFNLLLIGNRDKGTLNSEFYLRYAFNNKISVKGAYQFLFTELTTDTNVQTSPRLNDRFRNKASLASFGLAYHF
ncbi:MAG: hypothetical protein EAZ16_05220 [Sphingobacteriales bacterium]|nr:MAG: hypothetical protein EAZ16_05220 [Sphingobacteriales bacterium]